MTELEEIRKVIKEHRCQYPKVLKQERYRHLYQYIIDNTPLLNDEKYSFVQRIDWVVNEMKEFPRCKNKSCNKVLDDPEYFRGSSFRYREHCCMSCSTSDNEVMKKVRATKKKRYGNETFNNTEKRKKTNIKKYGVDSNMRSEIGLKRYKDSIMKKYGVENQFQREYVKEKLKKTKLERYGDENYNNIKKQRMTCACMTDEQKKATRLKTIQTNLQRYGVKAPLMNGKIRAKAINNRSFSRYLLDGLYFDSIPELAYYIYCKDNKIRVVYHPKDKRIEYLDKYGKRHTYCPDFYNLDENRLYEVKGSLFYEDHDYNRKPINPFNRDKDYIAEAKFECMRKNNVYIVTDVEYNGYISYVKEKYGKKFFEKCAIKRN